jgi:hypothetical protein
MDLLLVEWSDSLQTASQWSFIEEAPELKTAKCRTVGWLVGENQEALMLAQNIANEGLDDAQGSGYMRICKRAITKRKKLK